MARSSKAARRLARMATARTSRTAPLITIAQQRRAELVDLLPCRRVARRAPYEIALRHMKAATLAALNLMAPKVLP